MREGYQMFLEYGEAKGHAPLTISAYQQDQRCFEKFLAERNLETNIENLDSKVIRKYIVWMKSQDYSLASMQRKIDFLSSFFNYMEYEELIDVVTK